MPGTITRLSRSRGSVRTPGATLRLASRDGRSLEVLAGKHVAVFGSDASPHVTGFPRFTTSLLRLLEERSGQVSEPMRGTTLSGVPDLVVAVLPGPGAAGAAVALANRHDLPLLVIVQAETSPPTVDADTGGARLAAKLEGTALSRADRWAVTGEAARARLVGLGVEQSRIDSLPYWVTAPSAGQPGEPGEPGEPDHRERPDQRGESGHPGRPGPGFETERLAARRSLGWPGGFLVVCPVGVHTSGLAPVVAAAEELAGRGSDVQIVLAGRGPRLRALRDLARTAANVTVAEVTDDGYPAALVAADLLLVSEASDRLDPATAGRMAACLAAGRPLIAAVADDERLSAELARSEGAMVTIAPERHLQLADAIDVLRGAPQARAVMAAAARHYTRSCLGPAGAGARLELIAARTLGRSTGSSWWGRGR
jgi:Glycosyl transferase 4-like domain